MNIILASASPRRRELLKYITSDFSILVSNFDESSVKYNNDVSEYVMTMAQKKAENVISKVKTLSLIIGCDTVVFHNNKILGKPKNINEAFHMLKSLSGDVHYVYSGVSLINSSTGDVKTDYVCTKVKFMELSDDMINKYILECDPLDKAGSYGIQDKASIFVESIHGCFYNVVGLPINKLFLMMKEMGVNL